MGKVNTFWIGEKRHATVKIIGCEAQVVIRECRTSAQGKRVLGGKKGINLTVDEWCLLAEQCQDITHAMKLCMLERVT